MEELMFYSYTQIAHGVTAVGQDKGILVPLYQNYILGVVVTGLKQHSDNIHKQKKYFKFGKFGEKKIVVSENFKKKLG